MLAARTSRFRYVFLVGGFLVAGCMHQVKYHDPTLDSLLKAYEASSAAGLKTEAQEPGIRKLDVIKGSETYLVSVDLQQAHLAIVVDRLFGETKTPFVLPSGGLHGKVTAKFDRDPLLV